MDWANESYVRIYRRKTTTSRLLGWEGNAVMRMLMTELDRGGYLELDGLSPEEAVSLHTDMPIEVVMVGVSRLMQRGVLVVEDGRLLAPNYVEAQTTSKSEAQRQREARERERAEQAERKHEPRRITKRDDDVTERDTPHESGRPSRVVTIPSRNGTDGHDSGEKVTECPSPSQSVTLSLIPDLDPVPDPDPDQDNRGPSGARDASASQQVFNHWVSVLGKPSTVRLTPQRKGKVKARLRDGYTVEQLCQAVDGCKLSNWHMGENERGQPYNDLETILRSGKTVEEHIARLDAKTANGSRARTASAGSVWGVNPDRPTSELK